MTNQSLRTSLVTSEENDEYGIYKLFGKETGLGWDNAKNTFDASDECERKNN